MYRNNLDAALERIDALEREIKLRDDEIERLAQLLAEQGHGFGLGPVTIGPFNAIGGDACL